MVDNTSKVQKNTAKKKIIIILIIVSAVLLVMYALTLILPMLFEKLSSKEEEGSVKFNFYEPDYDEDIFTDEEYIALIKDGFLSYDDGANSISQISSDDIDQFGDHVELISNLVYSIQNGDSELYNSFFSDEYLSQNGKKENFTMQKIYDVTITYYGVEEVSDKTGNYTRYIYKLKYRIYENNGTFRQDIDEDAKTQYIVITERTGKLLIDSISTSKYK